AVLTTTLPPVISPRLLLCSSAVRNTSEAASPVVRLWSRFRISPIFSLKIFCRARRLTSTLSKQQLGTYAEDGFLLISDLIEPKVIQAAHHALSQQIQRSRSLSHHAFVRDSAVLACFTREVCSAAAVLAGARAPLPAPGVTYTITVFPTSDPWEWPKPHIDHALKEDAHRTFPPP